MPKYELHAYHGDGEGNHGAEPEILHVEHHSYEAARHSAGRLAVRIGGPVDIARDENTPWNERYETTASASKHHVTGYRFERLT